MSKFFPFILLLALQACSWLPFRPQIDVVAQVNKKQLLASDVAALIPSGLPREDSLNMLRQYINSWALAHLMEAKAQKELPKEQRDVSQALEEYRRSLLVFRYEKSYVETRIDTLITQAELKQFYNDNQALFVLTEPLVKVRYIKMGLNSPYLETVRSLYRSRSIESTYQLEQMAQHAAEKYETYNDGWISTFTLSQDLPVTTEELIRAIGRGHLECNDNFSAHFVAMVETVPAGSPAPIEYEEASIRNIIFGKRKQALIKNLEQEVLNDGWKTNQLKVYINNNE